MLLRANEEVVRMFLGPKEVACHPRSWGIGERVRDDRHERGMREERVRRHAGALPYTLEPLGDVGVRYFATLAATRRSIRTEEQRMVLLCELFGAAATASAIDEVMRTGHVGAEFVPLRLGDPALDALVLREPDLALYDDIGARRPLRDLGEPAEHAREEEAT